MLAVLTRLTPIQAIQGSVIRVSVTGIREEEDGTLSWLNPEVLGPGEVEDEESRIRKIAGKGTR